MLINLYKFNIQIILHLINNMFSTFFPSFPPSNQGTGSLPALCFVLGQRKGIRNQVGATQQTQTGLLKLTCSPSLGPLYSAMARRKKGIADDDDGRPADPETEERRRLRSLAFSRKLLRRTSSQPSAPLEPSKAVVRLQGRDIVKRGQRKSRYLFSFPGLLAPLSSGRIGELSDLGSKNPILYLEFPQVLVSYIQSVFVQSLGFHVFVHLIFFLLGMSCQGRMKLFGTHVYPKNKYLTLQLTKSSKGVMCEDVFESMVCLKSLSSLSSCSWST